MLGNEGVIYSPVVAAKSIDQPYAIDAVLTRVVTDSVKLADLVALPPCVWP